jgi:membrane protease YdiL (CAAX protease family)
MNTRLTLWAATLAFPLWLGCVAVLVRRLKVVPASDIGLTLGDPVRNLLLGCATAVVLTPLVLGLNIGASEFFARTLGLAPTEHPLAAAGKQGLFPVEWALVAFLVMVSAPAREELLFRGALQRLFAEHPWASHVGMGLALGTALISSIIAVMRQPHGAGLSTDGLSVFSSFLPVVFVLTMTPIYLVLWHWRKKTSITAIPVPPSSDAPPYPDSEPTDIGSNKPSRAPAVFATALLFGATHSFAWPTPIALFVLGLGLGYLAVRTRTLVPPVVVHCLFNAVSFVILIMGWTFG